MKKNLLLVLSLSAIILLTGCKQAEPVDALEVKTHAER